MCTWSSIRSKSPPTPSVRLINIPDWLFPVFRKRGEHVEVVMLYVLNCCVVMLYFHSPSNSLPFESRRVRMHCLVHSVLGKCEFFMLSACTHGILYMTSTVCRSKCLLKIVKHLFGKLKVASTHYRNDLGG